MKKLLSILMLLVAIVTGAWASPTTFFSLTEVKNSSSETASGADCTLGSGDATISGGTVVLHNGKNKAANLHDGQINLSGSGASYMHVTLTGSYSFEEGDIINFGKAGSGYIGKTSSKPSSTVTIESTGYVIPEGSVLIGQKEFYFWKPNEGEVKAFTSFTITRPDPTSVATPAISFSENKATIACATTGATIYYTLDGTEPTKSSTAYSAAVTLPNSCTVRAKAFKDENESNEATKDCYVDHSAAEGFLTILKFNGGSVGTGDAAKVWTSTDGKYVLTDKNNDQTNKWSNLEGSQDAFKLSHVDGYTLAVPSNVKITKVVFIGKSLYQNYAGTVAMTTAGFTPTNASFIQNENIVNFPMYLSTIEFTNSSLGYGDAIDFNPGGCESAAYIELYGEIKQNAIAYDDAVENGTISGAASAAEGVTVTVTATPADGYEFGALVIMNGETDVTSECSVEGTTFVMPAYDVTVSATFNATTPAPTPATTYGGDIDFDYSATGANAASWTQSPITVTTNATAIDSNGFLKSWGDGNLIVTVAGTDALVSKVVLTYQGTNRLPSAITADDNTELTKSGATQTWENTAGKASVTFTLTGSPRLTGISVEYASEFSALNTAGYGTFSCGSNVQVYGVKAYKAALSSNTITCTEIAGAQIPAGNGVLLYSSTPSAKVYLRSINSAAAIGGNDLTGSTDANGNLVSKPAYCYSLSGSTFKHYTGATLKPNKAFFGSANALSNSLDIVFEGTPTAVEAIAEAKVNAKAPIKVIKNGQLFIGNYNVAGQLVK